MRVGCVIHVAEDISAVAGGVPAVVRQLSEKIMEKDVSVQVIHAVGEPDELASGIEVFPFPCSGFGKSWSWGHGLQSAVTKIATGSKLKRTSFHIHGSWAAPQYFAARAAYKAGVPFVFSAHGMLEPWLWNEQGLLRRIKKMIYWKLFAYPALSKAAIIHAITPFEKEHLTKLFPGNRIEVIPNAIEVDNIKLRSSIVRTKTILFLGRVEPKKGVDLLISAFCQSKIDQEWVVDIVGPVWSDEYMTYLKSIVVKFEMENRVKFHDPVFGDNKNKFLDKAWVMAVPSHSEAVGLVNLEAATRYLPTITTHQTGLFDWENGGGVLIEPKIDDLRDALEKACSWSEQEQYERGEMSRRLVEERYSWKVVLPMWVQLYESLWEGC